jgi:hypothetical protein
VFYETPGHAAGQALALAVLVASELGWDQARCRREAEGYRAYVAGEEAFREHLP